MQLILGPTSQQMTCMYWNASEVKNFTYSFCVINIYNFISPSKKLTVAEKRNKKENKKKQYIMFRSSWFLQWFVALYSWDQRKLQALLINPSAIYLCNLSLSVTGWAKNADYKKETTDCLRDRLHRCVQIAKMFKCFLYFWDLCLTVRRLQGSPGNLYYMIVNL